MADPLQLVDVALLDAVTGGADSLGRCGPGSRWTFLGNVYTPQCLAHDQSVRTALQHGSSRLMAQVKSLALLPAAVGSYVSARFHFGP